MMQKNVFIMLFVAMVLGAVAVAVGGLQGDSIWHDEQLSILYAGGMEQAQVNPLDTVSRILERESGQAPFYYIVLSLWGTLVGWTVFAMRTFSLLAGVLAMAFAYRLAADIKSPTAGIIAAIFLGASAFFNAYFHEIRAYTFLVLEILITLSLYWRLFRRENPSRLLSLFFVIVTVATLYTHPFAIGAIGALGLYHLIFAPRGRAWWIVLGLFSISAIAFLPWAIPTFGVITSRVENNTRTLTIRSNGQVIFDILQAFSNGIWLFWLALIPSILLVRREHGARLLWFIILLFAGVMLAANQFSSMINHVRYMMPLLPLLAVLIGIGLDSLTRNRWLIALVLVAWIGIGFGIARNFGNDFYTAEEKTVFHIDFPLNEISSSIAQDAVADDAIALYMPYHGWAVRGVFDYYLRDVPARHIMTEELGTGEDLQTYIDGFNQFLGDAGRVWFMVDKTVQPNERFAALQAILQERYVSCGKLWDDDKAQVEMFAQVEILCDPPQTAKIEFGEDVDLLDVVMREDEDFYLIYMLWSNHVPADTYSFSLQVMDAEGNGIYQVDKALPLGDFVYQIARIPLDALKGDNYQLNGIVYAWQSGQRLLTPDGLDIVPLLEIGIGS